MSAIYASNKNKNKKPTVSEVVNFFGISRDWTPLGEELVNLSVIIRYYPNWNTKSKTEQAGKPKAGEITQKLWDNMKVWTSMHLKFQKEKRENRRNILKL